MGIGKSTCEHTDATAGTYGERQKLFLTRKPVGVFLFAMVLSTAAYGQRTNYKDWNGLSVEVPDPATKDVDFFNRDNEIYVPGREFVFSYVLVKNHDLVYCRVGERGDSKVRNWTLVKPVESDPLTIKYVGFKVLTGYGGLDQLFPEYSQTVIQQRYYAPDMSLLLEGLTGLVENPANVWIHPFRAKVFSVTELSPFPFVKFPLKAGRRWNWKLEDIDDRWSDARLVEYSGTVAATYDYAVSTKKKRVRTALGVLECFVIKGTARSRVGNSHLASYFNKKYGFVRLEYTNVDGSRLLLDLIQVATSHELPSGRVAILETSAQGMQPRLVERAYADASGTVQGVGIGPGIFDPHRK